MLCSFFNLSGCVSWEFSHTLKLIAIKCLLSCCIVWSNLTIFYYITCFFKNCTIFCYVCYVYITLLFYWCFWILCIYVYYVLCSFFNLSCCVCGKFSHTLKLVAIKCLLSCFVGWSNFTIFYYITCFFKNCTIFCYICYVNITFLGFGWNIKIDNSLKTLFYFASCWIGVISHCSKTISFKILRFCSIWCSLLYIV